MWRGKLPCTWQFSSAWTKTGPDVVWGYLFHPAARWRWVKEAERQARATGSAVVSSVVLYWTMVWMPFLSSFPHVTGSKEEASTPGLRDESLLVNIRCLSAWGKGFPHSSKALPHGSSKNCMEQSVCTTAQRKRLTWWNPEPREHR